MLQRDSTLIESFQIIKNGLVSIGLLFIALLLYSFAISETSTDTHIEILGLECALYCSKLFGLTHACGTNMATNDWQKDCCCD